MGPTKPSSNHIQNKKNTATDSAVAVTHRFLPCPPKQRKLLQVLLRHDPSIPMPMSLCMSSRDSYEV